MYADYVWAGGTGLQVGNGGDCSIQGNLNVDGEKNRVINTKNYSKRKLYAYESASPMFADIGEGVLDDDGVCCIYLDDIFSETVDLRANYQVFLQAYGDGKCYVDRKEGNYFIVKGTANLKFAWEIKAIQTDGNLKRLDIFDGFEVEEDAMKSLQVYSEDIYRSNDDVADDILNSLLEMEDEGK